MPSRSLIFWVLDLRQAFVCQVVSRPQVEWRFCPWAPMNSQRLAWKPWQMPSPVVACWVPKLYSWWGGGKMGCWPDKAMLKAEWEQHWSSRRAIFLLLIKKQQKARAQSNLERHLVVTFESWKEAGVFPGSLSSSFPYFSPKMRFLLEAPSIKAESLGRCWCFGATTSRPGTPGASQLPNQGYHRLSWPITKW